MNVTKVPDANTAIVIAENVDNVEKGALEEAVQEKADLRIGKVKKTWFSVRKPDEAKRPTLPNAPYWTLYRYLFIICSEANKKNTHEYVVWYIFAPVSVLCN